MTDQELYEALDAIYNAYSKIRELQKFVEETRNKIEEVIGGEDIIIGDRMGKHIHRIEDYIRGANATALKNEAPETFKKYGGKTSETNTLKVFAVENE